MISRLSNINHLCSQQLKIPNPRSPDRRLRRATGDGGRERQSPAVGALRRLRMLRKAHLLSSKNKSKAVLNLFKMSAN